MKPRKTPQKTPRRKPGHGKGELQIGNPGNKGGSGRPPEEFKQLCRDMASGELTIAQLQDILLNKDHQQFLPALRYVTEHGYGKPKESIEHSGTLTLEHLVAASR